MDGVTPPFAGVKRRKGPKRNTMRLRRNPQFQSVFRAVLGREITWIERTELTERVEHRAAPPAKPADSVQAGISVGYKCEETQR